MIPSGAVSLNTKDFFSVRLPIQDIMYCGRWCRQRASPACHEAMLLRLRAFGLVTWGNSAHIRCMYKSEAWRVLSSRIWSHPCSPLKVNLRSTGTYRLHLQGRRKSQTRNQREANSKRSQPLLWEHQILQVLTTFDTGMLILNDMRNMWIITEAMRHVISSQSIQGVRQLKVVGLCSK
jgi:hypothetical protein